jgi:hypothetical protein
MESLIKCGKCAKKPAVKLNSQRGSWTSGGIVQVVAATAWCLTVKQVAYHARK